MTSVAETVQHVVHLLANERYDELEALSKGVRLTAENMREALREYGGKATEPPAEAFDELDVIEVRNSTPKRYSVVMPLWMDNTSSDLSLELTIIEAPQGMVVEVDDIHVL